RQPLNTAYPAAAASVFAFTYIALPLGSMVQLRQQWSGAFMLVYMLLVVWAWDIFAYFVGRSVGRHRMAQRVGPKQTRIGAVESYSECILARMQLFQY